MSIFKPARRNTGAVYGYTDAEYYNEVKQSIPVEIKKEKKSSLKPILKTQVSEQSVRNTITHLEEEKRILQDELKKLNKKNICSSEIKQIEDLKKELIDAGNRHNELETKIKDDITQIKNLEKNIEEKNKQIAILQISLPSNVTSAQSVDELNLLKQRYEDLQKEYDEKVNEIDNLLEKIEGLNIALPALPEGNNKIIINEIQTALNTQNRKLISNLDSFNDVANGKLTYDKIRQTEIQLLQKINKGKENLAQQNNEKQKKNTISRYTTDFFLKQKIDEKDLEKSSDIIYSNSDEGVVNILDVNLAGFEEYEYESFATGYLYFTVGSDEKPDEITAYGLRTDKYDGMLDNEYFYQRWSLQQLNNHMHVQSLEKNHKSITKINICTPIIGFGYKKDMRDTEEDDKDFIVLTRLRKRNSLDKLLANCIPDLTVEELKKLFLYICYEIGKLMQHLSEINITADNVAFFNIIVRDDAPSIGNNNKLPDSIAPFQLELNNFNNAFVIFKQGWNTYYNPYIDTISALLLLFNAFSTDIVTVDGDIGEDINQTIQGALDKEFYKKNEVFEKLNSPEFMEFIQNEKELLFPGKLNQVANVLLSQQGRLRGLLIEIVWEDKSIIYPIFKILCQIFKFYSFKSLLNNVYTEDKTLNPDVFVHFQNLYNLFVLKKNEKEDFERITNFITLLKINKIIGQRISSYKTILEGLEKFVAPPV